MYFASLVDHMVKNLPVMQEMQVQSLGWEDPLEKEMATYSGILAWKIPWTGEPDGLQSMGSQRVGHDWVTNTFTLTYFANIASQSLVLFYSFYSMLGLPGSSEGKASASNAGDLGLIPGSGRSPEEGHVNPLLYSCLENPMDGEAW